MAWVAVAGDSYVTKPKQRARAAGELVRHHLGLPPGKYSVVRGSQPLPPTNLALSPAAAVAEATDDEERKKTEAHSSAAGTIIPSAPDLAGTELRELCLQALVVDVAHSCHHLRLIVLSLAREGFCQIDRGCQRVGMLGS